MEGGVAVPDREWSEGVFATSTNVRSFKRLFHNLLQEGRLAPMRKTARAIRAYNPILSHYSSESVNQPVTGFVKDILEKDSTESISYRYVILFRAFVFQMCDKRKAAACTSGKRYRLSVYKQSYGN